MLASTLSRPRCAMPITASRDAALGGGVEQRVEGHDRRLRALEAEALLADVARVQEPLEDLGRVQALEEPALLLDARRRLTPSTRCWIHCFCSGSWMCMYSMPSVRQYASRRIARISSSVAVSRPASPSDDEVRSRSQMVSP